VSDATAASFRGYLPGWHHVMQSLLGFDNLERIAGPGGQDFLMVKGNSSAISNAGFIAAIDVSAHWREAIA